MFEVRIELTGEATKLLPAANKPESSQVMVQFIYKWIETKGQTCGESHVDPDTDTIHADLLRDGAIIGRISAYEKPSTTQRALTGKFKAFKLYLSKIPADFMAKQVLDAMNELMAGQWPAETVLAPGLTVGDVQPIPGFYQDERLMDHIVAAFTGRMFRIAARHEFKINLDDQQQFLKIVPILESFKAREQAAIKMVVRAMIQRHGKVDEFDATKVDAVLQKIQDQVVLGIKDMINNMK